LVSTQPFFIAGIEDPSETRNSAFGAMFMFVITFALSIGGIWYDGKHKMEPLGGNTKELDGDYHLASDHVPSYGTST
jgi:hypothetical protein